jgi:hypothetical protein
MAQDQNQFEALAIDRRTVSPYPVQKNGTCGQPIGNCRFKVFEPELLISPQLSSDGAEAVESINAVAASGKVGIAYSRKGHCKSAAITGRPSCLGYTTIGAAEGIAQVPDFLAGNLFQDLL